MKLICSWCSHAVLFLIFLLNVAIKLWNFQLAVFSSLSWSLLFPQSVTDVPFWLNCLWSSIDAGLIEFSIISCDPVFNKYAIPSCYASRTFRRFFCLISRMTEYRIPWSLLPPLCSQLCRSIQDWQKEKKGSVFIDKSVN